MSAEPSILVLDAMGVLYQAGDDVVDLLVPYVHQHHSAISIETINNAYLQASVGQLDAASFWTRLGMTPEMEDNYLAGHKLVDGTYDFLSNAIKKFNVIACLSNDIAQWSLKLRRHFRLEQWISTWVISGDVGYRKPSAEIYLALIRQLNVKPQQIIFVDDRSKNLDAAKSLGFNTVLFDQAGIDSHSMHRNIKQLSELLS